MFVAGFARSGTTLLYRLLALDDAVRAPALWEVFQPAPRRCRPSAPSEKRVGEMMAMTRPFGWLLSQFARIHHFDPLSPEECSALRNNSFAHEGFVISGFIPSYLRWLAGLDAETMLDCFKHYRSQVQILAYHFPRRRWLSRTRFTACIWRVSSAFFPRPASSAPFAIRPRQSLPRRVSSRFAHSYGSRVTPPHEIGRLLLDWYQRASDSYARALASTPAEQFLDVEYTELVRNPIGTVRGVYEKFGLDLHPAHEAAMERWLIETAPQKHGKHHYSLDNFGLTAADIVGLR